MKRSIKLRTPRPPNILAESQSVTNKKIFFWRVYCAVKFEVEIISDLTVGYWPTWRALLCARKTSRCFYHHENRTIFSGLINKNEMLRVAYIWKREIKWLHSSHMSFPRINTLKSKKNVNQKFVVFLASFLYSHFHSIRIRLNKAKAVLVLFSVL